MDTPGLLRRLDRIEAISTRLHERARTGEGAEVLISTRARLEFINTLREKLMVRLAHLSSESSPADQALVEVVCSAIDFFESDYGRLEEYSGPLDDRLSSA